MKLKIVSYLLILLCVFTISCSRDDPVVEWELVSEHVRADGCTEYRYEKVYDDRIEYKEEIRCPDGRFIKGTPRTEYK